MDNQKLKTLVANIALQCVKAIEAANPMKQDTDCEFSSNQKSRTFKGHLFSNMVKIELFKADTQSYVP